MMVNVLWLTRNVIARLLMAKGQKSIRGKGEPMSKLYQNKWAGHETYFTPAYPVRTRKHESDAIGGYELIKITGKWECRKGQYYTHSLRDEAHFPVVGEVNINVLEYVRNAMLDALERRTDDANDIT
jgi:hypothetical protein